LAQLLQQRPFYLQNRSLFSEWLLYKTELYLAPLGILILETLGKRQTLQGLLFGKCSLFAGTFSRNPYYYTEPHRKMDSTSIWIREVEVGSEPDITYIDPFRVVTSVEGKQREAIALAQLL
jgi:hypothetical protein